MNDIIFPVFILLPSAAFAFASLATCYGWRHAYEAISWVPLILYLFVSAFIPIREFTPATTYDLPTLLDAIAWLSLVQGIFGLALVFRAFIQHKPVILLSLASLLAAAPFFVRLS